jgi:hypothetical protein
VLPSFKCGNNEPNLNSFRARNASVWGDQSATLLALKFLTWQIRCTGDPVVGIVLRPNTLPSLVNQNSIPVDYVSEDVSTIGLWVVVKLVDDALVPMS